MKYSVLSILIAYLHNKKNACYQLKNPTNVGFFCFYTFKNDLQRNPSGDKKFKKALIAEVH